MPRRQFEFAMPACEALVFDAFHYHCWRQRWDSLVRATHVLGGAAAPFVGAVTDNAGSGLLRGLRMQTRFISYQPPVVAAATMIGASFPFARWAASMRHRPGPPGHSVMIYCYSFESRPAALRRLTDPIVGLIFDWQTRKRFRRLQRWLAAHAGQVALWQAQGRPAHGDSAP